MLTILDTIVITDTNREPFIKVLSITHNSSEMQNLFIFGPTGSGKSYLATAKSRTKDLLSMKKIMLTHPAELLLLLTSLLDHSQDHLTKLAETDILFIDNFDDAFDIQCRDVVPEAIKYLVQARKRFHRSTVILARNPLSNYDKSDLESTLDDFEVLNVMPLDDTGRRQMVLALQDYVNDGIDNPRTLSDDAVSFLANNFVDDLAYAREGTLSILRSNDYPKGAVITEEMIRKANCQ